MTVIQDVAKRINELLHEDGSFVSKHEIMEIQKMLEEAGYRIERKKKSFAPLLVKYKPEIAEWLDIDENVVLYKIDKNLFNPTEMKLIITNILMMMEADDSLM